MVAGMAESARTARLAHQMAPRIAGFLAKRLLEWVGGWEYHRGSRHCDSFIARSVIQRATVYKVLYVEREQENIGRETLLIRDCYLLSH